MEGKTYRYFRREPLYPFGYGLSYSIFKYTNLRLSPSQAPVGAAIRVSVDVENAGQRKGDEVVQLYLSDVVASWPVPIRNLQGFKRITLDPGGRATVSFQLAPKQMSAIDDDGQRVIEPGVFEIAIGGCQPGYDDLIAGSTQVLTGAFELVGQITPIE